MTDVSTTCAAVWIMLSLHFLAANRQNERAALPAKKVLTGWLTCIQTCGPDGAKGCILLSLNKRRGDPFRGRRRQYRKFLKPGSRFHRIYGRGGSSFVIPPGTCAHVANVAVSALPTGFQLQLFIAKKKYVIGNGAERRHDIFTTAGYECGLLLTFAERSARPVGCE
jgi:hypothetical protein